MRVKVSKEVLEGIKSIRDSGLTNMFDYNQVMRLAMDNGFYKTVNWMTNNKKLYAEGIFKGFETEEDESASLRS